MGLPSATWLPVLVLVPALALWGYCLIDFTRTPVHEMRTFDASVWWIVLVFGSVVGGVLWLCLGRPQGGRRG